MNNQILELPKLDIIEREASGWVEKLDRGLAPAEYPAFKQWMSLSKRHRDSVVAMAELWDQMDIEGIIAESEAASIGSWREEDNAELPYFVSLLASLVLLVGVAAAGIYGFQHLNTKIAVTDDRLVQQTHTGNSFEIIRKASVPKT